MVSSQGKDIKEIYTIFPKQMYLSFTVLVRKSSAHSIHFCELNLALYIDVEKWMRDNEECLPKCIPGFTPKPVSGISY